MYFKTFATHAAFACRSALVALLASGCAHERAAPPAGGVRHADRPGRHGVRVDGARLVDLDGRALQLRGVSYSGAEYACQRTGAREHTTVFDGPSDDTLVDAIARWGANTVRLPLNGQCWLEWGDAYAQSYADLVRRFVHRGLFVIVDLHWSAPAPARADRLRPMPNAASDVEAWRSIARRFAGEPAVIFDAYNEPFPDRAGVADAWGCWRDGCDVRDGDATYRAAGMREIVGAIRSAGARQPILLAGIDYANDLRGWLEHRPADDQLVASVHVYSFNRCKDRRCWNDELAPIARAVPVVATEIGEDDCAHAFVDEAMRWADERDISYLGWAFNPWGGASPSGCGAQKVALVADWSGTPTPYGAGLRDHLRARAQR